MSSPASVRIVRDDGGRAAAGFPPLMSGLPGVPRVGHWGDCACRAITIATGVPYAEVHAALVRLAADPRAPDDAMTLGVIARYLTGVGWEFTLNRFEQARGRVRHATLAELAARGGSYVVDIRAPRQGFGHCRALVDGELRDLDGEMSLEEGATKPIYGWWTKAVGQPRALPPQYFDMGHAFVPRAA